MLTNPSPQIGHCRQTSTDGKQRQLYSQPVTATTSRRKYKCNGSKLTYPLKSPLRKSSVTAEDNGESSKAENSPQSRYAKGIYKDDNASNWSIQWFY